MVRWFACRAAGGWAVQSRQDLSMCSGKQNAAALRSCTNTGFVPACTRPTCEAGSPGTCSSMLAGSQASPGCSRPAGVGTRERCFNSSCWWPAATLSTQCMHGTAGKESVLPQCPPPPMIIILPPTHHPPRSSLQLLNCHARGGAAAAAAASGLRALSAACWLCGLPGSAKQARLAGKLPPSCRERSRETRVG